MKAFMKKHRKLLIACGAGVLVTAVAVTGVVVVRDITRPAPSSATGVAGRVADAAASDDWAALPTDAKGKPIGEPKAALDKHGDPIIPAGQAEEKRSADQPLPVVTVKSGAVVVDTTAGTAALAGMMFAGENPNVTLNRDDCLLDWARTTLPTVSGSAFSGIISVCGRDAAVMYGGYSTSVRDLNLHALYSPDKNERTTLSKILFKNDQLGYASVATEDGQGILLVVAAATGDTADKTKGTNAADPITKTEPVVPEMPAEFAAPKA